MTLVSQLWFVAAILAAAALWALGNVAQDWLDTRRERKNLNHT